MTPNTRTPFETADKARSSSPASQDEGSSPWGKPCLYEVTQTNHPSRPTSWAGMVGCPDRFVGTFQQWPTYSASGDPFRAWLPLALTARQWARRDESSPSHGKSTSDGKATRSRWVAPSAVAAHPSSTTASMMPALLQGGPRPAWLQVAQGSSFVARPVNSAPFPAGSLWKSNCRPSARVRSWAVPGRQIA